MVSFLRSTGPWFEFLLGRGGDGFVDRNSFCGIFFRSIMR